VTLQLQQLDIPLGQRLLLRDIDWHEFEAILTELGEHRATRIAYYLTVMKPFLEFTQALINPKFAPTALRVALIIGTLLLAINHGAALVQGKMTRSRWASALLTYLVPYGVNIHGQLAASRKRDTSSFE